jgi:hypothetical protein
VGKLHGVAAVGEPRDETEATDNRTVIRGFRRLHGYSVREQPPSSTSSPTPTAHINDAPEHIKTMIYDAFDIQALYRQHLKQATIWVAITDDAPAPSPPCPLPLTDNDTFGTCHLSL